MLFIKRRKEMLNVNMVPLINVIFLLLIFFMVAGQIERLDVLDVAMPSSSSADSATMPKMTTIYIDVRGNMAVNEDLVSKEDMVTILQTILARDETTPIEIKADRQLEASKLLWLLQRLEAIGAQRVLIHTQAG